MLTAGQFVYQVHLDKRRDIKYGFFCMFVFVSVYYFCSSDAGHLYFCFNLDIIQSQRLSQLFSMKILGKSYSIDTNLPAQHSYCFLIREDTFKSLMNSYRLSIKTSKPKDHGKFTCTDSYIHSFIDHRSKATLVDVLESKYTQYVRLPPPHLAEFRQTENTPMGQHWASTLAWPSHLCVPDVPGF